MKSHVGMEQHQCLICLQMYDTGGILLDLRLRPKFEDKVLTGHGHCPSCQGNLNDGMIALIETAQDATPAGSTAQAETQKRSGSYAFIKEHAFQNVFNVPVPEGKVCFVEYGILEHLKKMTEDNTEPG